MNSDLPTCIFLGHDLTTDTKTCFLCHEWRCETDSSICGDYEQEE